MSVITNVIVACANGDKGKEHINGYEHDPGGGTIFNLVSVEDPGLPEKWYGGGKVFTCELYIGAVNWLDVDSLRAYLASIDWDQPEYVQIIYKKSERPFQIINVFDPE